MRNPQEIDSAFIAMSKAEINGLIVFSDPVLLERNRASIITPGAQVPDSDCLSVEELCRGGRPGKLFGESVRHAPRGCDLRR